MREFMDVSKALADENRVRVMMVLQDQELCVCQLIEVLGLAPSTVSKHMSILRQARLVVARKAGRWIHYRRNDSDADEHIAEALAWLDESLQGDTQVMADRKRLNSILKLDPEVLCCQQASRVKSN